tara:strand:+ start:238 stop:390 length:153 start_codon:yes stop_codon:yes gene_type:complete
MPQIKNKKTAKKGFEKFQVEFKKSAQGAKAFIKKVLKKKENSDLFSKKVH